MRNALFSLLSSVLGFLPAFAYAETDLATLQLGPHLMGPKLEVGKLVGNVVMVEFWGTH